MPRGELCRVRSNGLDASRATWTDLKNVVPSETNENQDEKYNPNALVNI